MVYLKIFGKIRIASFSHNVRGLVTTQCLSSGVDKSALSRLRKKTGYPFINCRKALVEFNNDVEKAEEWLVAEAQKQGWTKASKLEGRTMSQGLIGIVADRNMAAMTEISCETDFVSRNKNFQSLVERITRLCLAEGQSSGAHKLTHWGRTELNMIKSDQGSSGSVADLVALEVGNLGENMQARRAVFYQAPDMFDMAAHVHTAGLKVDVGSGCQIGKYGALLSYKQIQQTESSSPVDLLGRHLCQHIVGMNPESIGNADDEPSPNADDETKLIHQEFLLDPDIKVSEYLVENNLEVDGWVRFELGGVS